MKRLSVLVVLVLIAAVAGCSSLSVKHDYDPEVDFSKFTTYAWYDLPSDYQMTTSEAQVRNSLLDGRLKSATDAELKARGMEWVEVNPDLYIVYHVGVKDRVDITNYGYGYGGYGYRGWHGGYHGNDFQVYNYQEGTLIVDFIDADTKELVWRGTAQKVLGDAGSPERAQAEVDKIMAKMLALYPPKVEE